MFFFFFSTLFFFNDTATTEIYTLSLHDALPIYTRPVFKRVPGTEHFYSELPDEVLKANGLTPHAEVM